ncbi:MAG TPA: ATP-binding protein [Ktedonobacterales bacterium]|nr:ATP-binding protein [Ktedonobacterales bacterium]
MDERLRILLIDDNPDDRSLTIRELQGEFPQVQVQQINNARKLNQALEFGDFDVVITDYQLRWSTGLSVLRLVKQRYPDCPVIMFTNSATQEMAVEAMKSGLDDYVVKSPRHFVRLAAAVRSVLEHAETERRVARLEGRLQELLNRLNVGVFRATTGGLALDWNQALLRILGLPTDTRPALLNLSEWNLCPEPVDEHLQRLRERNQPLEREQEVLGRDGVVRWVFISELLSLTDEGEIIDGLLEDRTEWKQAEREAKAALEAREQFLTLAAHELRSPLTALTGSLQLARRRLSHPPAAQQALTGEAALSAMRATLQVMDGLLERAERHAKRLHRLAADILNFVQMEDTIQQPLYMRRLDLSALALSLTQEQEALWPGRVLLITLPETPVIVLAEAEQIKQAFTNYLNNAFKFSPPPQPVTLTLRVEQGQARLEVSNAGPAIAPEEQARIWERFYRAPGIEHQSGSSRGLGLGLAICKAIIEQHGGQVGVESAPGQNTIFWFTLPLASTRAN